MLKSDDTLDHVGASAVVDYDVTKLAVVKPGHQVKPLVDAVDADTRKFVLDPGRYILALEVELDEID